MINYKNPVPHLPDQEQCNKIKLCFSFKEPVTKDEAAKSLSEYFKKHAISPEHIVFDGEITIRDIWAGGENGGT